MLVAAGSAVAACGDDPISIRTEGEGADYQRGALREAVTRFVVAGRTPEAYGALARDVASLRPGMDATVAEAAELELVVLAAAPIEAVADQALATQTERLALTVWPVALAPPIDMLAPDGWRDPREAAVAVLPGETAREYVRRMCGGPLAVTCRHVTEEWQGPVLGTEVITRLTQRVRRAIATCEECGDPGWLAAVSRWEALDREGTISRRGFEARGATDRWPVAGSAAAPWPEGDVPIVEVEADGDWLLDGVVLAPASRIDALRERRDAGAVALGVYLPPDTRVEVLDGILPVVTKAGWAEVAVQARHPAYPWALRAYTIATNRKGAPRATDTLQVHLRSLDLRADAASPPTGAAAAARRR